MYVGGAIRDQILKFTYVQGGILEKSMVGLEEIYTSYNNFSLHGEKFATSTLMKTCDVLK